MARALKPFVRRRKRDPMIPPVRKFPSRDQILVQEGLGFLASSRSREHGERMSKKKDVVQVKNPKSGHYVKIDRSAGKIVSHKQSAGPYKHVPIARSSATK